MFNAQRLQRLISLCVDFAVWRNRTSVPGPSKPSAQPDTSSQPCNCSAASAKTVPSGTAASSAQEVDAFVRYGHGYHDGQRS